MDLDLAVCQRQENGWPFEAKGSPTAEAKRILAGNLRLAPHPDYALPAEINWLSDPFNQRNWRFQFNSLRWLDPLRREALLGGELAEAAAREWIELTKSWMGSSAFTQVTEAQDMADGLRAIELTVGLPLIVSRCPDDLAAYVTCLRAHCDRMANPKFWGRGNHALHQMTGLFVAASLLRDHARIRISVNRLEELLAEAFDDEGVSNEAALGYAQANLTWWKTTLGRLAAEGHSIDHDLMRLDKARNVLRNGTTPAGLFERFGDAGKGLKIQADGSAETEYIRSLGARGIAPTELATLYRRGYVFGRSGWGSANRPFSQESFYSVRFGLSRDLHGHSDSTSVTFHSHGVNWLVDPGMIDYSITKQRRYIESPGAHNVVVDSETGLLTRVRSTVAHYAHTSSYDWIRLRSVVQPSLGHIFRDILYLRGLDVFVVLDSSFGQRRARHYSSFRAMWQFHPESIVEETDAGWIVSNKDQQAKMAFLGQPRVELIRGSEEPYQGWYSSKWGEVEPACVLAVRPVRRVSQVNSKAQWAMAISASQLDIRVLRANSNQESLVVDMIAGGQRRVILGRVDQKHALEIASKPLSSVVEQPALYDSVSSDGGMVDDALKLIDKSKILASWVGRKVRNKPIG